MFGTVEQLDDAVQKMLAEGPCGEIERLVRIAEEVEYLKLREIRDYELSGAWQAEGFVSTASALRKKCRMSIARGSVVLARKLEVLPEIAAAFAAGEISRAHAEAVAHAHTPDRAAMIENLDREFANLARLVNPAQLRDEVQRIVDAFDGGGGATEDERQHELNKVYFSPTVAGRGALNGSLDAELSRMVEAAFNAEMEVLKLNDDTRTAPQRRAEALESMCRRSLDHHDTGTRRRRGHPTRSSPET